MRLLILLLPTAYPRLGYRGLLCVMLAATLSACASVNAHRIKGITYEVEAAIAEVDYQALGLHPLEKLATYNSAQVTVGAKADYFKVLGGSHRELAQPGYAAGVAYIAGPGAHFMWLRIEVVKADELPDDVTGYIDAHRVLESWPQIDDFVVDTSSLPLIRPDSGPTE
jgi:hypothetical protein